MMARPKRHAEVTKAKKVAMAAKAMEETKGEGNTNIPL